MADWCSWNNCSDCFSLKLHRAEKRNAVDFSTPVSLSFEVTIFASGSPPGFLRIGNYQMQYKCRKNSQIVFLLVILNCFKLCRDLIDGNQKLTLSVSLLQCSSMFILVLFGENEFIIRDKR